MGKGAYFACQIRHLELYLLQHHRLPPPRTYTQHGQHSLLNNKAIHHCVNTYLASQPLGTITPHTFAQHLNEVILPTLEIDGKITQRTAQRWLKFKLGYEFKEVKKGMYIDGHEHPDIIKEREEYIDVILGKYEQYVDTISLYPSDL